VVALIAAVVGGWLAVALHNLGIFVLGALPGAALGAQFSDGAIIPIICGVITGSIGLALFGLALVLITSFLGGVGVSLAFFAEFHLWLAIVATIVGFFVQALTADEGASREEDDERPGEEILLGIKRAFQGWFGGKSSTPASPNKRIPKADSQ